MISTPFKGRYGRIAGDIGLGVRNERGERMLQFSEEYHLIVCNTFYKLPPKRLYTWIPPADNQNHIVRNQIDYILINDGYRNTI